MSFLNGVYLAPDLERGDLWLYRSAASNRYHLFRLGEKDTLCGINQAIKYRERRPDQRMNLKPFTGWKQNKNRHGEIREPWCKTCVDAYARQEVLEE